MPSDKQKKTSFGLNIFILLLLSVVTLLVIFRGNDFENFITALKTSNFSWLLAGLCCMFVFVSCEAVNMFQISKTIGRSLSLMRCEQYAFIGFYFSSVTPSSSGGQPAQMYYMKKDRISLADSSLIILYIVMVYQIAMLMLAGLMTLIHPEMAIGTAGHLRYLLPFGLVVNGSAAVFFGLFLYSEKLPRAVLSFFIRLGGRIHLLKSPDKVWERTRTTLNHYHQSACIIREKPFLFIRVLLTSMIQMSALSMVPYCVYRALGYFKYSAGQLVTCQSILTLSASAVPTPGAVGAAEGGFLFAFEEIFGAENIKTAMLLSRGISLYLFLILSFVVCMAVQIRISRQKNG